MRHQLLTSLLRDVSRSFYLTLRVLPTSIRHQIGLAYLLARATDTIADSEIVPVENRLAVLASLLARILGQSDQPLQFAEFTKFNGASAEQLLLNRIEEVIEFLNQQTPADIQLIRGLLKTITSGQKLDLQRFGTASTSCIIGLSSWRELDDYTYRVAGCVGKFWTECCLQHLPNAPVHRKVELLENGVRFGKGLQLTNILRDLPKDLRMGRCYLPSEDLRVHGLLPNDLLDPVNFPLFTELYSTLINRAEADLRAGWDYTNSLPRSWVRVRLACAWPVLIGLSTLEKLRRSNVLEAEKRIKVSRNEVRTILFKTICLYPFSEAWRGLGGRMKSR